MPATAAAEAGPVKTSHFGPGNLRILLAEDNKVNQRVGVLMLEQLGYRADIAGNGREVLDAIERAPYDVILMDVRMPEMDGIEATRHIRAQAGIRQPRIVAMTASAFAEDRDECRAAGMDDYVAKPVRREELVAALERCAAGNGQEGDPVVGDQPASRAQAVDLTVLATLLGSLGRGRRRPRPDSSIPTSASSRSWWASSGRAPRATTPSCSTAPLTR